MQIRNYKREREEIRLVTTEDKYQSYKVMELMYDIGTKEVTKSVEVVDKKNGISDLVYVYKGYALGKVPNFETCEYWINQIPLFNENTTPIVL